MTPGYLIMAIDKEPEKQPFDFFREYTEEELFDPLMCDEARVERLDVDVEWTINREARERRERGASISNAWMKRFLSNPNYPRLDRSDYGQTWPTGPEEWLYRAYTGYGKKTWLAILDCERRGQPVDLTKIIDKPTPIPSTYPYLRGERPR